MSTKNPTKHTAIALTAAKTLEAIEVPTRSPGDNEVLIKVDYASYGAGDAHAVDDNFEVFEYPEGLGLVATGKIVEVGKSVEGLKEGDEVSATGLLAGEMRVGFRLTMLRMPSLLGRSVHPTRSGSRSAAVCRGSCKPSVEGEVFLS